MEWSSLLTTLLGVPLAILPQVVDTRYLFCFKKYNALKTFKLYQSNFLLSMLYSNDSLVPTGSNTRLVNYF